MMMMGGMGGSGGSMGSMGGMSGSGGSMGMMDMMNMGGGGSMGTAGQANMGSMGSMPGMADPYAMNGLMNQGGMPGMNYSGGAGGMTGHGTGTAANGLFGFGGQDINSLVGGLLNLAVDIFAILLIVGLVVGAAVLIKRYVFDGEIPALRSKTACRCGQALNAEWACCPKCGEAKVVAQPVTPSPQPA